MSQDSLTSRYRPQNFAQVAGQDAVKRILSRAAATRRVAPAYLLSGTRGVGKTTIARIFAKALNCLNGPGEEPCNACSSCRQITAGAAVDVVEIDGASNTGVDNVRRLKEDVGYAPLECRYKVIIIDEAHMLSRQAFNALLKTLEEPPGHVTFIMATTEPEKFPQTIISRCQHFVFKRLPRPALFAHLQKVLEAEGIEAEPEAVQLIARRGAGSVRDSMSLLAQTLAFGYEGLTLADVRDVLGLAGQEVFADLIMAVRDADLVAVHDLLEMVLDQGLDLGFFLRELAVCWRNLFLLRQLGERARPMLDLPDHETEQWAALAPDFSVGHLHGAWQMTLDAQRRILTSMEPALALELLLFNLASLPSLLPVSAPEALRVPTGRNTLSKQTPGDILETRIEKAAPKRKSFPKGAPSLEALEQETPGKTRSAQDGVSLPSGPRTAEGFLSFCQEEQESSRFYRSLEKMTPRVTDKELVFYTPHAFLRDRLDAFLPQIASLASLYFERPLAVRVDLEQGVKPSLSRAELKDLAREDGVVQEVQERFQARIMDVRPVPKT